MNKIALRVIPSPLPKGEQGQDEGSHSSFRSFACGFATFRKAKQSSEQEFHDQNFFTLDHEETLKKH
jgi:hypothetical protein